MERVDEAASPCARSQRKKLYPRLTKGAKGVDSRNCRLYTQGRGGGIESGGRDVEVA